MKIDYTVFLALNVSPVRMFRAYMAAKIPHRWCGMGSHLPLPLKETAVADEHSATAVESDNDAESGHSHNGDRKARSPPRDLKQSCWRASAEL